MMRTFGRTLIAWRGDDDGWDIRPRGDCGRKALALLVGAGILLTGAGALIGAGVDLLRSAMF